MERLVKNIRGVMALMLVAAILTSMCVHANSQSPSPADVPSPNTETAAPGMLDLTYVRPTPRTTLKNYAFDAFGPYAFAGAALTAGLDQETKTPPEWKQGAKGYGKRFASDFGIALAGTTTRYGLAAVFRVDTSYYRCDCRGAFPRMRYAVLSTVAARSGRDGHRVFSFPSIIAPYAGMTAAVYGWYPNRYGIKDALRMGNYSLLESVGLNVALEFLFRGPHALASRAMTHAHDGSDRGPDK